MNITENLEHYLTLYNIVPTIIFILVVIITKYLSLRIIKRSRSKDQESKQVWVSNLNSFLTVLFIIGVIFIWGNQIKTFALSVVALSVALVLALKELLLCLSGTFYKAFAGIFSIGDRIQIAGIRGEVVDRGLFSTKMLEIGPSTTGHQYTGRSVVIPNALFLTNSTTNESYFKSYILHIFSIPLKRSDDWQRAETIITETATKLCTPYLNKAQDKIDKIQQEHYLDTPSLLPRVNIKITSATEMELIIRITAPTKKKGALEQEITREFLTQFTQV
jgi:small-conductance mechanosensitive channel